MNLKEEFLRKAIQATQEASKMADLRLAGYLSLIAIRAFEKTDNTLTDIHNIVSSVSLELEVDATMSDEVEGNSKNIRALTRSRKILRDIADELTPKNG